MQVDMSMKVRANVTTTANVPSRIRTTGESIQAINKDNITINVWYT